ncbi:MAG TPA: DUF1552 domain-containing protein [Candidatus Dormibacteraeota bacterium]|nr:DUF1552 domain-containing protein [Candidatus Dormibacteraeota bacterium]
MKTWQIPRRTFLKGLGTLVALPALEAMRPLRVLAGTESPAFPRRMAFVYIPNGANMADWTPSATGTEFELPMILEPLKEFQQDFQVLTGLAHDKARPHGDGAGDHARASATFLTGCQARKTAGVDIKVGVSVDQIAAEKLGRYTRLPSLELGGDRKRPSGNCDSGYSCAYQFNLSWRTESSPVPPEVNPRLVFERLFSNSITGEMEEGRAQRLRNRKSILDFVSEDANRLKRNLGQTDQRKLDEYLTSVRELEQRLERAEQFSVTKTDYKEPTGIPEGHEDRMHIMFDLLTLAFQTDSTRVATYLLAHDGSNTPYPEIGVPEGHHDLSHHGNDDAKKAKIAKINQFHATQFAYFLKKLKAVKEGDGTLLDNCMIVYGGGISDGNAHNHDNLPILLAGRGGGTLQPGRHVRLGREVPTTNLYLSMLERLGVPAERIGDSTGKLDNV